MFTESTQIVIDSINVTTKSVSIAKDTVVKKDGIEIARSRDRCAFYPGDIELVKDYMGITTGPEIDYLNAIWTADVISEYLASQTTLLA